MVHHPEHKEKAAAQDGGTGLYLHFPFCTSKCRYCHFYSVSWERSAFETWKKGIALEAESAAGAACVFDTVYIGGGTPSLLSPEDLDAIFASLRRRLTLQPEEFTLEANPGPARPDIFKGWRKAGVSRLSIGIQSFDDEVLRRLGRTGYTADEALHFVEGARRSGLENISVDLLAGVPGETRHTVEKNLAAVERLNPDHVSVYFLEELDGLPGAADLVLGPDDEDAAVLRFEILAERLESLGIGRYEISNFSRPGCSCRHNLKYWRYEPFLGLGPSAASHIGNLRWTNMTSLEAWFQTLQARTEPRADIRNLDGRESLTEALVFGLRLGEGVDTEQLGRRFGTDIWKEFGAAAASLEEEGSLCIEAGRWRIPPERWLISNTILCSLIFS